MVYMIIMGLGECIILMGGEKRATGPK